jgi:hypothetical protein
MRETKKNIIVAGGAIFFIVVGLLFLIFHHRDNLVAHVPGEVDGYLHANGGLGNIEDKYKNSLNEWLEDNSSINKMRWEEIQKNGIGEFGLFIIKNQMFGVMENSESSRILIKEQGISYTIAEKVVIFPQISSFETSLVEESWYRSVKKRFNFSEFTVYLKNADILNKNFPELGRDDGEMAILGEIEDGKLELRVYGKGIGKKSVSGDSQMIKSIPSDYSKYAKNMTFPKNKQKTDYTIENFNYLLLQNLKGPIEYLEQGDSFVAYFSKELNDIDLLKAQIAQILAYLRPEEQIKYLPDSSIATQLIANPSSVSFENNVTELPEFDLRLEINENEDYFWLTRNKLVYNDSIEQELFISDCSRYGNNQVIMNATELGHLIIINKSENRVKVCVQ